MAHLLNYRDSFKNEGCMQLVPVDQELPMQKWSNLANFMLNKNSQKVEDVLKEDFVRVSGYFGPLSDFLKITFSFFRLNKIIFGKL